MTSGSALRERERTEGEKTRASKTCPLLSASEVESDCASKYADGRGQRNLQVLFRACPDTEVNRNRTYE
jgi:hypothetical protein